MIWTKKFHIGITSVKVDIDMRSWMIGCGWGGGGTGQCLTWSVCLPCVTVLGYRPPTSSLARHASHLTAPRARTPRRSADAPPAI